ncbi:MAG: pyridoxamine 5'-phosphate oxidase family protein [Nitriliruptoraceae bacterium]|nr:pyridoxamine 5'-phosphate oxidase family protein [Nitriliruptoraceae bacterium]
MEQRSGDLVPIDPMECVELLGSVELIRVALTTAQGPTLFPVNHVVHDDAVYFRTAPGSKLGAAAQGGQVAIEADETDAAKRTGWSVIGHGTASIVTDTDLVAELHELPFEPWALPDTRDFWVRVDLDHVTGRRIRRDEH